MITIFGYCCPAARRGELVHCFKASVYARPAVIVVFGAFVALGVAKPILILLGPIDLRRAIWLGLALRSSPKGV
ncbi:MAG: hypothetical protein GTO63_21790 [Anaerolineae bacterium]|nr:hypothetical protein [Anaerolineae bacterium]NIN97422.1 hypothetical protein [Anaerolineae bacterium]NIQ80354.1 hypothetical protein [Anaerolineae bacterium]